MVQSEEEVPDPEQAHGESRASSVSREIYVIPHQGHQNSVPRSSGNHRPQILVLPYVPIPSTTSLPNVSHPYLAPPPHYYQNYDPPPEYNSWMQQNPAPLLNTPLTTSTETTNCSCCTQETFVPQSGPTYHLPRSVSDQQPTAFLDSGLLYANYQNGFIEPTRVCRSGHIPEDSETEYEVPMTDLVGNGRDTLLIRRWVLIILVLGLLITVSLLIGITLQHFQLMSRLKPEDFGPHESESGNNTTPLPKRPFMLPGLSHHF